MIFLRIRDYPDAYTEFLISNVNWKQNELVAIGTPVSYCHIMDVCKWASSKHMNRLV